MSKFVVRVIGVHWDARGEVTACCWLSKESGATTLREYAWFFSAEAEAWEAMRNSGQVGRDSHGEWCWVEAAELSAGTPRAPVIRINGKTCAENEPFEVHYQEE